MSQLNEFLDEKKSLKIDLNTILMVLTHLKELELMSEVDTDADEYRTITENLIPYSGCICGTWWTTNKGRIHF